MSQDFSPEELALLKKLGISLPKTAPTSVLVATEFKTVHVIVSCKLCGTVSETFVKLQKVDSRTWTKLCDLSREDIGEDNIRKLAKQKTANLICPHCVDVLMQKEKKELVEMLIDRAIPKVAPPTRY